jgi:lipopolysaccharide/colanic/teichoic acid biosynthesis glycosyltransferase
MPLSFATMIKRLADLLIVLFFSPLWVPLALFIALLVRIKLGSPVLFHQIRPGLNAEPFKMIKFRTMTEARDQQGNYLPDEQRLTVFARLLRATSLDELPELINVLLGEMSLVGPRPLLMQYLPLYTSRQARRHEMKPGLTGWAQINGRNAISWDEKLEMDVWYVEHHSLWLDLKILALTLLKVLTGHGISAPGHATAPYFTGSTK